MLPTKLQSYCLKLADMTGKYESMEVLVNVKVNASLCTKNVCIRVT